LLFKEEGLTSNLCFSVSNYITPATSGEQPGYCAETKFIRRRTFFFLLHRKILASNRLSEEMDTVMKNNHSSSVFCKIEPLNNMIMSQTYPDIGLNHAHLLYYAEVMWPSRGNVRRRVAALCCEV